MPVARISPQGQRILRELAKQERKTQQQILDQALEHYRRQQFLKDASEAYSKLRQDDDAWTDEQQERAAWTPTIADGLQNE